MQDLDHCSFVGMIYHSVASWRAPRFEDVLSVKATIAILPEPYRSRVLAVLSSEGLSIDIFIFCSFIISLITTTKNITSQKTAQVYQ